MKITFIRHAESYNNYLYFLHRSGENFIIDPPLSALGEQQAAALADFLTDRPEEFNFDQIFISPFLRTLQTAAAFTPLYPESSKTVWTLLQEGGGCREVVSYNPTIIHVGHGLGRGEMQERFPDFLLPADITEQGWFFLETEESFSQRMDRARRVVEQLLLEYGASEAHIALVSHGEFFNLFVNALLGRIYQPGLWFSLENTAVAQFRYTPNEGASDAAGEWHIDYVNRCEWLRKGLTRDW